MDIAPSTVSTGDTITLLVTRTEDGDVTAVDHECALFLKGETDALESCLEAHEYVEAEFTVTNCMWAQTRGADMLSVTVNSCRAGSTQEAESKATATPGAESSTEEESGGMPSEDEASRGGTHEETGGTSGQDAVGREEELSEAPEEEPRTREREAAAVVDWDPDEPLDRDVLQRVLNRGQRVTQPSEREDLDYGDRNAVEITAVLIDLASELEVSSPVCYRAAELYAEAMRHDIVRGRAKEVTAAAAFRVATLQENEHRPIVAIEETLTESLGKEVHAGAIADQERQLVSKVDINPSIVLIQPQKFLPFLAHRLDIDETAAIIEEAESFATRASSQGTGNSPWSIAAAAVYCAGRQSGVRKVTQKEVAQAASLSEVTIRNNYKLLLDE